MRISIASIRASLNPGYAADKLGNARLKLDKAQAEYEKAKQEYLESDEVKDILSSI